MIFGVPQISEIFCLADVWRTLAAEPALGEVCENFSGHVFQDVVDMRTDVAVFGVHSNGDYVDEHHSEL